MPVAPPVTMAVFALNKPLANTLGTADAAAAAAAAADAAVMAAVLAGCTFRCCVRLSVSMPMNGAWRGTAVTSRRPQTLSAAPADGPSLGQAPNVERVVVRTGNSVWENEKKTEKNDQSMYACTVLVLGATSSQPQPPRLTHC